MRRPGWRSSKLPGPKLQRMVWMTSKTLDSARATIYVRWMDTQALLAPHFPALYEGVRLLVGRPWSRQCCSLPTINRTPSYLGASFHAQQLSLGTLALPAAGVE